MNRQNWKTVVGSRMIYPSEVGTGTGGPMKLEKKKNVERWNNRFRLHSIRHGKQRYELSSFFYQQYRLNLGNGLT